MITITCSECGEKNPILARGRGGYHRRKYCRKCGRQLFPVKRVVDEENPYDIKYEPATDNVNFEIAIKGKTFEEIKEEVSI